MTLRRTIYRLKKSYYCMGVATFLVTFAMLLVWKWHIDSEIIEEYNHFYARNSQIYSDTGCQFPILNPFSEVAMKYDKNMPKVACDGEDWVECDMSECQVTKHILHKYKNIKCHYKDIIYVNEHNYVIAPAVTIYDDNKYFLNTSDFFKVSCFGYDRHGLGLLSKRWHGYKSGIRPITNPPSPTGREKSLNILILGFDSTSRYGFIRKMPKSYKYITQELQGIVLTGYNIVGDGTPDALFPILSGRTELQHPYARQRFSKHIYLDPDLFIFHTAKQDGYQTAYYEDMPWIGSFQYRYNGFRRQPTDHYLRSFLMEESKEGSKWWNGIKYRYCIGAKPQYLLLLNLTGQFMNLKSKRFCFTFIADISHDDFNRISTADEDVVDFLRDLKGSKKLEDTLLIVMGDHGPRFSPMRATYQGKIEERMAFMSIILPESLKKQRPDALDNLKSNSDVLTTPFDIHTTILDAMGLKRLASDFVVPNSKILRGLSLLETIPKTRTCDEAAVLPHWCVCLNARWYNVDRKDPMYKKIADSLTEYINNVTEEMRQVCVERKLKLIEWVTRRESKTPNVYYQAMIIMTPGRAAYEASLQYNEKENKFIISDKDVSRISAYGDEPACVSKTHPHLNKYCYCKSNMHKSFDLFKFS
ncbi:uncharacterized protein LOC123667392 [Melitaea cinxia]|uniref:uncharacterized protein LOC123667392 n=1 Tax=Melitaea cinxia TaxID=113334 RepID=UPI001E2734C0|nr:uncharacterized protein LOC123667392 [Melitaea cinxia]